MRGLPRAFSGAIRLRPSAAHRQHGAERHEQAADPDPADVGFVLDADGPGVRIDGFAQGDVEVVRCRHAARAFGHRHGAHVVLPFAGGEDGEWGAVVFLYEDFADGCVVVRAFFGGERHEGEAIVGDVHARPFFDAVVFFDAVLVRGGDGERQHDVAEVGELHAVVRAAGGDVVVQAVKVVERDGAGGKGGAGDGGDGAPLPGICHMADGEGGEGGGGHHDGKAREEAAGAVALPAQERADGKEDEAGECQRHDEAVVVGRADGDFAEVQGVGK